MPIYEDFVTKFIDWGEESPTNFSINHRIIDNIVELREFNTTVFNLNRQHHDFEMHFAYYIEHEDSGFNLELNIYSEQKVIVQKLEIESELELKDIFKDNRLVYELQKCKNAHDNSKSMKLTEIEKLIENIIKSDEINSVNISFSFNKKCVFNQIADIDFEDHNIIIYLSYSNFKKYIEKISFKDLKKALLDCNSNTIILIEGLEFNCSGNYLAIFDLENVIDNTSIVKEYINTAKKDIAAYNEKLQRTVAGSNHYILIPPQYFNFLFSEHCTDSLKSLFYPSLLFNLCISFSDSIECLDNSCKLRINSKRTVYGNFSFEDEKFYKYTIDENTVDYNDLIIDINKLYHFYLRTFGLMNTEEIDETKVLIAKKVISIYSRTYLDILTHIEDIINSASSEYKLYIRERVDDFISFKEQVINYRFNQNKEIIKFNSDLSETLSNTFFKIIGFVLVFIIGLIAEADGALVDEYMLIAPLLLSLFILFSIYRLHTIKILYYESKKHQKKYETYFNRYLSNKEINKLGETIDDSIFNKEYSVNFGMLFILFTCCIIFWVFANKDSLEVYINSTLQFFKTTLDNFSI